jgi:hypothetical protein
MTNEQLVKTKQSDYWNALDRWNALDSEIKCLEQKAQLAKEKVVLCRNELAEASAAFMREAQTSRMLDVLEVYQQRIETK